MMGNRSSKFKNYELERLSLDKKIFGNPNCVFYFKSMEKMDDASIFYTAKSDKCENMMTPEDIESKLLNFQISCKLLFVDILKGEGNEKDLLLYGKCINMHLHHYTFCDNNPGIIFKLIPLQNYFTEVSCNLMDCTLSNHRTELSKCYDLSSKKDEIELTTQIAKIHRAKDKISDWIITTQKGEKYRPVNGHLRENGHF